MAPIAASIAGASKFIERPVVTRQAEWRRIVAVTTHKFIRDQEATMRNHAILIAHLKKHGGVTLPPVTMKWKVEYKK